MSAYYNEIDGAAAHVLECLISENIIAPGVVDRRSIRDVRHSDLDGFTQCHFFAGGGLWSVAARLAGWPDDKPLWTGSCPCQPFSVAGKGAGIDDERHLWPDFFRLISARRPAVVMGEQVAGKAGRDWFHGVRSDLEGGGYAGRAVDVPALAVDAPHIRQRLYWLAVADTAGSGLSVSDGARAFAEGQSYAEFERGAPLRGALANADRGRRAGRSSFEIGSAGQRIAVEGNDKSCVGVTLGDAERAGLEGFGGNGDGRGRWSDPNRSIAAPDGRNGTYWSDSDWIKCHDGKARRSKPGLRLLVDGMAGRIDLWRLAGNSIVPQLAAEVLRSYLETEGAFE